MNVIPRSRRAAMSDRFPITCGDTYRGTSVEEINSPLPKDKI
jgi:hypothetical protein